MMSMDEKRTKLRERIETAVDTIQDYSRVSFDDIIEKVTKLHEIIADERMKIERIDISCEKAKKSISISVYPMPENCSENFKQFLEEATNLKCNVNVMLELAEFFKSVKNFENVVEFGVDDGIVNPGNNTWRIELFLL